MKSCPPITWAIFFGGQMVDSGHFSVQLPLHYIFSKIYIIHYLILFHNLIHSNRNSYCSTNHRIVTHTKIICFSMFCYNTLYLANTENTSVKGMIYILLHSIIIYYILSSFIFGGQMVGKILFIYY